MAKRFEISEEKCIFCGSVAKDYHHVNPSTKKGRGCRTNAEYRKCIPLCKICHEMYFHPSKYKLCEKLGIKPSKMAKMQQELRLKVIEYLEKRRFCSECGHITKKLHIVLNSYRRQFTLEPNQDGSLVHSNFTGFMNSVGTLCTRCAIQYVVSCDHKKLQYSNQKKFRIFRKKYDV